MLTDLAIAGLKPKPKQYLVPDIPNFYVRVSQSGAKAFVCHVGKERKRLTVGRYPDMSLKDARIAARRLMLQDTPMNSERLKTVLDIYERLHLSKYKGNNKRDTTHLLRKYFKPLFEKEIRALTARQITNILDPMTPAMHNHMFGLFRTFFNWCERRDYIERSPIAKLSKPYKAKSRERVLTDDELKRVYIAARNTKDVFSAVICLAALTGQRRGELAQIEDGWLSCGDGGAMLTIPASKTKNGKEHRIPLPHWRMVYYAKRIAGSNHNYWNKPKIKLDKASSTAGWTIHDLRRTFATNCARLGVNPVVIERILNHAAPQSMGGSIAAIYNRHQYTSEMKQALDAHAKWLHSMIRSS